MHGKKLCYRHSVASIEGDGRWFQIVIRCTRHCCKKHRKLSNKFTRKIFPFSILFILDCLLWKKKRLGIIAAAVLSYRILFALRTHTTYVSTCMLGATRKIVIMCIIERAFEEMRYCWGMSESSTIVSILYDDMQVVMIVWNFCLLCGFTVWIVDWNGLSFVDFDSCQMFFWNFYGWSAKIGL